jgi:dimethylargininase
MIAITRAVSPRINECELTYKDRKPIDPQRAREQHGTYESWLVTQGLEVVRADDAPDNPDGVFVEDTAFVLDEVAIITRPGAESRRSETESVARVLKSYREVKHIVAPATIDGGDVIPHGKRIYIGLSTRTNDAVIDQLDKILVPFGYVIVPVPLKRCLHLKSAASVIDDHTILYNPACVHDEAFHHAKMIEVDPSEPGAANVLRVGERLLMSSSHPRTAEMLMKQRFAVDLIHYGEMEKAEAGVTCCSILVR